MSRPLLHPQPRLSSLQTLPSHRVNPNPAGPSRPAAVQSHLHRPVARLHVAVEIAADAREEAGFSGSQARHRYPILDPGAQIVVVRGVLFLYSRSDLLLHLLCRSQQRDSRVQNLIRYLARRPKVKTGREHVRTYSYASEIALAF